MNHYHLVGVGGIGMCGVARLLLQQGARVSGSDTGEVGHLKSLIAEGLTLYRSHAKENFEPSVTTVVYSVAVSEDNPEILEAQSRQLPLFKYAQMVGNLMKEKKGICVAGTHGKTTISALVTWILKNAGQDPSYIIGAEVPQLGGSSRSAGDHFVLESCEYDRSFHNYYPEIGIVANIDLDHLDYYQDLDEIKESFKEFATHVNEILFVNGDDENCELLREGSSRSLHVKTFGFSKPNDLQIVPLGPRRAEFHLNSEKWLEVELGIPGKHNLLNAAAAALVAHHLGCPKDVITSSLKQFSGAERRFQILSEEKDLVIVDDYAHHPNEIEATLQAAHEIWPEHKKVIVFQPHQRSRTRFLLDDFACVLSQADLSILPEIYFVRDSEISGRSISSLDLVTAIQKLGGDSHYVEALSGVNNVLKEHCPKPAVVLLLGAGDIWKIGETLCL